MMYLLVGFRFRGTWHHTESYQMAWLMGISPIASELQSWGQIFNSPISNIRCKVNKLHRKWQHPYNLQEDKSSNYQRGEIVPLNTNEGRWMKVVFCWTRIKSGQLFVYFFVHLLLLPWFERDVRVDEQVDPFFMRLYAHTIYGSFIHSNVYSSRSNCLNIAITPALYSPYSYNEPIRTQSPRKYGEWIWSAHGVAYVSIVSSK